MRKGILITFEGGEGCGKSTQVRLLYRHLKKQGRRVFLTREPGGTRIGDRIRRILLDRNHARMTALCETLLYMASRAQLAEEAIKPKLERGFLVLCDRWLDATTAYQGYGAGLDVSWIESLGRVAAAGVKPKATVFLDLPVKMGLRRAASRRAADRMEEKGLLFHKKVREGYLAIARKEPRRVRRIRVGPAQTVLRVHAKVWKALADVI